MNTNQNTETAAPVELTAAELEAVSGGINPQPLPPHVDPEARA
jgi:hypothetical protein